MERKLERCRKCLESKAILRVQLFYGRLSYICKDCEKGYTAHVTRKIEIPYYLKN